MYYVTMTDRFMSGWGMAAGKSNKLVVKCATWDQAQQIANAARRRSEMRYINIRSTRPYYGDHVLTSWREFSELGGYWLERAA